MSDGVNNLRRGDRVRIKLNSTYRYYLNDLVGTITQILHHGAIVALDNDPARLQKVIAPAGKAGPAMPPPHQRVFQFNELERL